MTTPSTDIRNFQTTVWAYYAEHARSMPWRVPGSKGFDPYAVMVSELMLQQTQVSRVLPKYQSFMEQFPTVQALAAAPLGSVIIEWQGLGYNRRAKFLHAAALMLCDLYNGAMPHDMDVLCALPGVGKNTAGAIRAYAFNEPAVFIETNIRTVLIHHFYPHETMVDDRTLIDLMERNLSALTQLPNPAKQGIYREWYWALMDYGTHVKASVGNVGRRSKHFTVQSAFHGSRRQVRGAVLRELAAQSQTVEQLVQNINDERLGAVLNDLKEEGLIHQNTEGFYQL